MQILSPVSYAYISCHLSTYTYIETTSRFSIFHNSMEDTPFISVPASSSRVDSENGENDENGYDIPCSNVKVHQSYFGTHMLH